MCIPQLLAEYIQYQLPGPNLPRTPKRGSKPPFNVQFSQMNHNVFCVIDDAMKRYRAMNMKRKKTSTEGGLLLLEGNKESDRAAFIQCGW